MVIVDRQTAGELSETEPPERPSAHTILGIEIEGLFYLLVSAGEGVQLLQFFMDIFEDQSGRTASLVFDDAGAKRFARNVLYALLERPQGLEITSRVPSVKSARKNGRKYTANVEFVIQAPTRLPDPDPDHEPQPGKSREMGWTWSVRSLTRGHWRRQAVGPRGAHGHRTIWIRPHWRGPEDAPLSVHPIAV
jgi:hypothetical protein